jgi:hypothetical protein
MPGILSAAIQPEIAQVLFVVAQIRDTAVELAKTRYPTAGARADRVAGA